MADNVIDTLQLQIESDSRNASRSIGKLADNLLKLQKSVMGIENIKLDGFSGSMDKLKGTLSGFTIPDGLDKGISALYRLSRINSTKMLEAAIGVKEISDSLQGMKGITIPTLDGMDKLVESARKLGGVKVGDAAKFLPAISKNLTEFVNGMNKAGGVTFDFANMEKLISSITTLGGAKSTQAAANLKPIKEQLTDFIKGLNGIKTIDFDVTGLSELVSSIAKLGGKSGGRASQNIKDITDALSRMMTVLSKAPRINGNVIQMTNAMANLASNGAKVGTAARGINSSFNMFGSAAGKASKRSHGLAATIGRLYATFWMLQRGVSAAGRAIQSSMDFIESYNYFDVALSKVGRDAADNWEKAGYESAEAYAESFKTRMLDLNKQMTGFEVDESGYATYTNIPNLGMNPQQVLNYSAMYAQMADSMGMAGETALKTSKALVMLGADWASLRNISLDTAWGKFASALAGETEAIRQLGLDITQTTLQQTAYKYGLDMSIQSMDRATKTQLMLLSVLDQSKVAFGDMARTIESPANQLRLFQQNIANLARTIGNLFLPIVSKVLPYVNGLIIALQRLFALLGLKINIKDSIGQIGGGGAMGDFAGSAGDAADALGDAADNAKKLKNYTARIDELNIFAPPEKSGGGAGGAGGGGGLLDDIIGDALAEYESIWDQLLKNNKAQEIADKIYDFFMKIADAAQPTIDALQRLWKDGLAKLGEFTWTALEDFYNEFLRPVGEWTLGTGLPMLIDALNDFLNAINWTEINDALRRFWKALEPFAEAVGTGLIHFFDDLLQVGASFINKVVPDGLNSIADALNKISYKDAEKIGYALGILATSLVAFKGILNIATGIKKTADSFKAFFKITGAAKYSAIAVGIGAVVVALDKFGYINVNWGTVNSALSKLYDVLKKFAVGIGKGLIVFLDGLAEALPLAIGVNVKLTAKALEIFANVLDMIPENAIAGVTTTLLSFFTAWKTYKGTNAIISGLTSAMSPMIEVFRNFGFVLEGIGSGIGVLDSFKMVFGAGGLGGIQFALIVGGLTAVTIAFKAWTDELQKPSPDMQKWVSSFDSVLEKSKQTTDGIRRDIELWQQDFSAAMQGGTEYGETLAQKYVDLANKENKSALEAKKMKQYAQELVDIYPGLNQYINEETGLLDANAESIKAVIEQQKALNQYKAMQDFTGEAYQNQFKAQVQFDIDQKSYDEATQKAEQLYKAAEEYAEKYHYSVKEGSGYGAAEITADAGFSLEKYNKMMKDAATAAETAKSAETQLQNSRSALTEATNAYTTAQDAADKAQEDYILQSPEMQESINGIKDSFTEFIPVTDEFATKLAMAGEESVAGMQTMFDNIKNGVEVSSQDMMTAFSDAGMQLPKAFADAIAGAEPEMQAKMLTMFGNISSGVKISAEELKQAFSLVGLELPDAIVEGLASKEPAVQQQTLSLLGNIESGQKLYENDLRALFQNLGIIVPDELISSLDSKGAEVQENTVELLSKMKSGIEVSGGEIKALFTQFGYDVPDAVITSISSKGEEVLTSVTTMLSQMSDGVTLTKDQLTELYSQLGLEVPDALISSISGKNAETQGKVTELLSQFSVATDSKKGELIEQMKGLGIDTADQLSAGFSESMANDTKAADESESWAEKLATAVRNFLGIHSPSTLFKEFGQYVVEGFNEGIRNTSSAEAINTWMESVKAAFAPEQWTTAFSNILPAFQQSWVLVTEWWNGTAIPEFFAAMTGGAFSLENWMAVFENMRLGIQQKWLEITTWWTEDALPTWWKSGVEEYFNEKRWMETLEHVRKAFEKKWEEIDKLITKRMDEILEKTDKKLIVLIETWEESLDLLKEMSHNTFTEIKNDATAALDEVISKIEEAMSKISELSSSISGMSNIEISLSGARAGIRGFAGGGMPEMGELFVARESGPEFVGTFGSRTAVANNDQIVQGITNGVSIANMEVVSVLNDVRNLLHDIREKDMSISLDGRELISGIDERRSRNGFSF